MNKKCWILFGLCMFCGVVELVLTIFQVKLDVLSVVVCSLGILFFILFMISLFQFRKESDK